MSKQRSYDEIAANYKATRPSVHDDEAYRTWRKDVQQAALYFSQDDSDFSQARFLNRAGMSEAWNPNPTYLKADGDSDSESFTVIPQEGGLYQAVAPSKYDDEGGLFFTEADAWTWIRKFAAANGLTLVNAHV